MVGFFLSEALVALLVGVVRLSSVGCSGWLSLALVACSSCLTAEAVVALLVALSVRSCPRGSFGRWLALGWVVTAAVARCLALGWLSVLGTLLGSLRLLWLSLGRLVCSGWLALLVALWLVPRLPRLLWLAFLSVLAKWL